MKKKVIHHVISLINNSVPRSVFWIMILSSAALSILAFAVPLTALQIYDRILTYKSFATLSWLTGGCIAAV